MPRMNLLVLRVADLDRRRDVGHESTRARVELDLLRYDAADLVDWLHRHGIAARPQSVIASGGEVGDMILSCCSDQGADLLVMGAYGHSRLRELVLGGATRTVLDGLTLPALLTH